VKNTSEDVTNIKTVRIIVKKKNSAHFKAIKQNNLESQIGAFSARIQQQGNKQKD